MGSHWWYRSVKSSLFSPAVSCGGRTSAKEGSSAKFELISGLTLASQSSFISIETKDQQAAAEDVTNCGKASSLKTWYLEPEHD